jgi:hypothetical protein
MQFSKAEPNEDFLLGRWVSENNIWEIGFCPVAYGVRVRLGRVGNYWVNLDYCADADTGFAYVLLATVVLILSYVPENITEIEVERMFPWFEIKPINRDPTCWKRLQEMADELIKKGNSDDEQARALQPQNLHD